MKIKILFLLASVLAFGTLRAQNILTIDEAIAVALKNNFDILVSQNDATVAKTNNTAGNAGMLPDVDLRASGNYAMRNGETRNDNTSPFTPYSLNSSSVLAGAELSWTLFDGGKMFVTKSKLNEIEALGEIRFRQQVSQTLSDVVAAYYNIVKQKQQLNSINQTMSYNLERVKITQTAYNAGSVKKSDLLQAKIDLNVIKENAILQKTAIETARRRLAILLSMDADSPFEVADSIVLDYTPDKAVLQQKLFSQNTSVQAFEKQLEIGQLALKESQRSVFPKVNFDAGYYYSISNNTSYNRSYYPQIGGSVSVPIFHSGNLKRQIALANIEVQSMQYDLESIKLQKNTELQNALTSYNDNQQLLDIERENFELAKENLEISLQRMRLGEATSLEVHQAQQDYVQSATRLINFEYNQKLAETDLKQLLGEL